MDDVELTKQGRQLRRERQFMRTLPTLLALWHVITLVGSIVVFIRVGFVQGVLTFLVLNVWSLFFYFYRG